MNITIVPPQPLVHQYFWVLKNMCTQNLQLFPWKHYAIQLQSKTFDGNMTSAPTEKYNTAYK